MCILLRLRLQWQKKHKTLLKRNISDNSFNTQERYENILGAM